MRILVGWDDPLEAETIALILNVEDTIVNITSDADEFERIFREATLDVVLMAVRRTVLHCQRPRHRRRWKRSVLGIRGRSAEGDHIANAPGAARRWLRDRSNRARVADGDRDRRGNRDTG